MSNLVITLVTGAQTPWCGVLVRSGQVELTMHIVLCTVYSVQYSIVHYITLQCITVYSVVCNTLQTPNVSRHQTLQLDTNQCLELDSLTGRANTLNCLTFPHFVGGSEFAPPQSAVKSEKLCSLCVAGLPAKVCSRECIQSGSLPHNRIFSESHGFWEGL